MDFTLHERLAADTLRITELDLCTLLLMRDHRFPWTILVPRRPNLRDYHDLPRADALQAFDEIVRVSNALDAEFRVDKLNVAALGNQVPQLHIHVIGRYETDEAMARAGVECRGGRESRPHHRRRLAATGSVPTSADRKPARLE